MTHHGFIDESLRKNRYLLTAVLVPAHGLAAVTREVRSLFPKGNRRTHLSAESKHVRRQLLKGYAAIAIESRVVVASYEGGDDQDAREACLGAILERAADWRLTTLVMDSRGHVRDRRDRQFIAKAIREGFAPEMLGYSHRGSRDEPLLSLPDAIGWAVGAGRPWCELVDPVVTEVIDAGR